MRISATEPDWSREVPRRFWDPSRKLLKAIRDYQNGGVLSRRTALLRHRFWSAVTGADIPLKTRIGGGLLLPHPNGIVIHPGAQIGPNCTIFQQATVGNNKGGVPVLGGHVDVGPGARVLGGITIANDVLIGANSVVLEDIPERRVVVGIPARIIRERRED